jgi:ribonuclease HI/probable phosphoglycerate mutase
VTTAVLNVDGASFGNPGPSGIGYVLSMHGRTVEEVSLDIGWGTNNQAEYRALEAGLRAARSHGATRVMVRSDSQLLVNQMKGKYRVKDARLKLLKAELDHLVAALSDVHFEYVPRELNARADDLAKAGATQAQLRGVRPAQETL